MVAAFGLKALSVGPLKEYLEGGSYRKGGSTPPMVETTRARVECNKVIDKLTPSKAAIYG
jgi:hypothetical protein